jgi:PRC-barrel domain protein
MDHPRPGLRYVSVHDLNDERHRFEDMTVHDPGGERLGLLEGFILNINSARPYYVVVDGGGWFRSKHFLLPIGHVTLDSESRRLLADVTKDHVKRFPGFDLDEFKKMSDADLYRMSQQIVGACCPDEAVDGSAPAETRFEIWAHYRTPTWWDASYYDPSRETKRVLHRE